MSVINQVLNQLEQRGAHTAPGQTMVRAVPQTNRKPALPLLILGLALAIAVAAWQWLPMHKPKIIAVGAAQRQPAVTAATTPVSAVPAEDLQEQPRLAEIHLPASRLSFELNSVSLPSGTQELKGRIVPGKVEELAAVPASSTPRQASEKASPAAGEPAKPAGKSGKPLQAQAASPAEKTAAQPADSELPLKQISPAQRADAEFRKATALMQQGHITDALAGYEAALRLDARHEAARYAWVALLLESKRGEDAERVLQDGLNVKPEHTGFAMLLARLQVERGAVELAMATLKKSLPYAGSRADYQAFLAALLQRLDRHKEAINHYQLALQLVPGNGVWLMGYGISLQAVQRNEDARDAFRRALESKMLNPELQAFVQQKIKEL